MDLLDFKHSVGDATNFRRSIQVHRQSTPSEAYAWELGGVNC